MAKKHDASNNDSNTETAAETQPAAAPEEESGSATPVAAEETATTTAPEAAPAAPAAPAKPKAASSSDSMLSAADVEKITAGYTFDVAALQLGALLNPDPVPSTQIRIPFGMLNRHGLVAGATGTGKTKTLQVLAEQIADGGVPVFAADIKGDLSGIAVAGAANDKLTQRTASIGQDWKSHGQTTEFFSLGGLGNGLPIRATVQGFGSVLLAKVLGLNETQESSLGLVFHYAEQKGLKLIELNDLQTLLTYLTSDGKAELKAIGGLSPATAGVILREIINLAAQGADKFFGAPQIEVQDFLRTTSDGKGVVSMLELAGVQDKPALFSTFLMWLLSELYNLLPEVGDQDKPKLVFFFDEAHLLFTGASKAFLEKVTQTVRLIRSKGVGIFFVTQTPKDVPGDVLAQLGSRVQHALRAHTPDDAKALKATVGTYPNSGYDLATVLTELGTGEAIITVMNEKGAPTPVAWTRLRAPEGSMDPAPAAAISSAMSSSPLASKYANAQKIEGAAAALQKTMNDSAAAAKAEADAKAKAKEDLAKAKAEAAEDKLQRARTGGTTSRRRQKSVIEEVVESTTFRTIIREFIRGLFKRK